MNRIGISVLASVFAAQAAFAAGTPQQKCEGAKNEAAGKLSACLGKAQKKLVLSGDGVAFNESVTKCTDKFGGKWSKLEQAALDAGGSCPDALLEADVETFVDGCSDAIATALAGGALPADPVTCNTNLTTCNSNYSSCQGSLTTCNGSLSTCNSNYSTCSGSLATCNAGTAGLGDVLSGKTFSSTAGLGVIGTMTNNGAVSITPGISAQTIATGYHNGSGSVAGDADLVATNITNGVNIFGVTGTALPAQPLRTGQTLCYNTAGTVIACAGTGQDGNSLKGVTRSYTDNGNGTITDSKTGLVWEKLDDNNVNGIHDKDRTFTWDNAFKKAQVLNGNVAGCIALNNPDSCCTGAGVGTCSPFAGQTDWRLPNQFELISLTDLGRVNPAIDPVFNTSCAALCTVTSCSCTVSDYYWSATTYQGSPSLAWGVSFYDGSPGAGGKTLGNYVRAVRGGS